MQSQRRDVPSSEAKCKKSRVLAPFESLKLTGDGIDESLGLEFFWIGEDVLVV